MLKRTGSHLTLLSVASMGMILAGGSVMAAELALKRAVLGAGGVGYFEYVAEVDGNETLLWRAKLNQIDDILKSIVVMDEAGPASVTLPGKDTMETAFASLPFGVNDLSNTPSLLSALRGAEVSVSGPRRVSGRIVNVASETVKDKDGNELTTKTRVSLISEGRVEQFVLEDAEGITFSDKILGEQVTTALDALRANQDKTSRNIAIRLSGGGKRTVRVGMVMEAPVWKAAYRLSLPKDGGKARLQGWAVLENMTGSDWKDVNVTLSAASPVTFRQALYNPYYVSRPTIAPPVSQAAMPETDVGQMAYAAQRNVMQPAPPAAPMGQLMKRVGGSRARMAEKLEMSDMAEESVTASEMGIPVDALGQGGEFSDSSENIAGSSFTLASTISVKAGESITTPFVDMTTDSDAVSWVQAQNNRGKRAAWHAIALKNDGTATLPPGVVTLYENTDQGPLFSGEAQLAVLPIGDSRMLGFGLDQKLSVDAETRNVQQFAQATAAKGVLTLKHNYRVVTTYQVKNVSDQPKKIALEHPRMSQFKLVNHEELQATLTPTAYRLRFEVKPGETKTVEVILETPRFENVVIGDISEGRMKTVLASAGMDAATKARLEPVMSAAKILEEARNKVNTLVEARQQISEDQNRIRSNLNSSPGGSDLQRLYSQKLLEQEKNIDMIDTNIKTSKTDVEKALAQLVKAVEKLQ